jgi:hypothetical protein
MLTYTILIRQPSMLKNEDLVVKSITGEFIKNSNFEIDAPPRYLKIPRIWEYEEIENANIAISELNDVAHDYFRLNENNMETLELAISHIDVLEKSISLLTDALMNRLTEEEIEEINMIRHLSMFFKINKLKSKTIDNLKIYL